MSLAFLRPCRASDLFPLLSLAAIATVTSALTAAQPCVHFDVTDVVVCRPQADEQFQQDYPGEMLIEATFEVSSLVRLGSEGNLSQYLYVIESPRRTLSVHDYLPKTQLVTELAGNVDVQKRSEKKSSLGVNASANPEFFVSAGGNASAAKTNGTNLNYALLPPKQLLAASGTISRGSAVYFKLKPSAQTSMDGAKVFKVVFRVPVGWRGDYVRLRSVAYDRSNSGKPICGSSDFLVGLYILGDEAARETVAKLSEADRHLRRLAATKQEEVDRHRFPSATDKLGAFLNVSRPKIPNDWLHRSIHSTTRVGFERHLPKSIRDAVRHYRVCRDRVHKLNQASKELAAKRVQTVGTDPQA